jgi:hypothetical protein
MAVSVNDYAGRDSMLDINVEEARNAFIEKLRAGEFTVERSQNSEDDYSAVKLKRDSQAVEDFLASDLAEEIKRMK